jgi:hypothetical protein
MKGIICDNESVEFDGMVWNLYDRYRGKPGTLHQYIYKKYVGELKYGYDIHHIDENISNNLVCNLIQIKHGEHSRLHGKNRKVSSETKMKISISNRGKGHPQTEETKAKLRMANKGQIPWNKGKKMSDEYKEIHSKAAKNQYT